MTVPSLLAELRRRDIQVWAEGERLRLTAPADALTPELRERLRECKNDILKALASAQALAQERAIVPLQASGARVPVFAVPGHNGDVFCYRAFAQHLADDQPFYGLQPPGVDGQDEPLTRAEDIAACFARQIRAFRPQGPYVIAGYCAGGTVAFELAQQLVRGGANVSLLALFGSPHPAYYRLPAQLRKRLAEKVAVLRDLGSRSPAEYPRYFVERLRRRRHRIGVEQAAASDPVIVLRAKVERATLAAVRAYVPRDFPGRVGLFLPAVEWPHARRWTSVARRAEEYIGSTGCGVLNMLREPNVTAFAKLFNSAIARL